ncbi:immunity protein YezG family protein [Loigolactobacillus binensis]|uniref:Immunity protein YezG family protein n=1 Tax=Loigolactobacillus binensis TaxID=2559922 RepID=A0ABW3EFJ7_9LACO|nr:immunity protein YezG family protein [Loigolactobacillus binensis]
MTKLGKFSVTYGLTLIGVSLFLICGVAFEFWFGPALLWLFLGLLVIGLGGVSFYFRPDSAGASSKAWLRWYLFGINFAFPWLLAIGVQTVASIAATAKYSALSGYLFAESFVLAPLCIIVQGYSFCLFYCLLSAGRIKRTWLIMDSVMGLGLLGVTITALAKLVKVTLPAYLLNGLKIVGFAANTGVVLFSVCAVIPLLTLILRRPDLIALYRKNRMKRLSKFCYQALNGLAKENYPQGFAAPVDDLTAALTATLTAAQNGSVAAIVFNWSSLVRQFVDATMISQATYLGDIDKISQLLKKLQRADYQITIPHFYQLEYTVGARTLAVALDFRQPQLWFDSSRITGWAPPYQEESLSLVAKWQIYQRVRRQLLLWFPDRTKQLVHSTHWYSLRAIKARLNIKGPSRVEQQRVEQVNTTLIAELQALNPLLQQAQHEKAADLLAQILAVINDNAAPEKDYQAALNRLLVMVDCRRLATGNESWVQRVQIATALAARILVLTQSPNADLNTPYSMPLTTQIDTLLAELVRSAAQLIPEKWHELYLFADVTAQNSSVYLYYSAVVAPTTFVDGLLPQVHLISKTKFDQEVADLQMIVAYLRATFVAYKQEPFRNLVLHLTSTHELKVKFTYTDWHQFYFSDEQILAYLIAQYSKLKVPQHNRLTLKKMAEYDQDKG